MDLDGAGLAVNAETDERAEAWKPQIKGESDGDQSQTHFKPGSVIGRSILMASCNTEAGQNLTRGGYVGVPYRCLGAGLDGAQVGDPGLADDGFRDHTLNAEVRNLDRDKVLVGDVDEILEDGEA